MDMGSSSSNTSVSVMMTPWLHFASGDNLIFEAWHPSSSGAIGGACVVLVAFSILERWTAAFRGVMEARWRMEARAILANGSNVFPVEPSSPAPSDGKSEDGEIEVEVRYRSDGPSTQEKWSGNNVKPHTRVFAPFILRHDLSRGVLYALQALMGYALMLSVMTFQAAYVISIICGLGIGEALFGRVGSHLH